MTITTSSEFISIALTCLLIFGARIMDVSIGTMRIIFVSKGYRRLAPVLGFVEVFIWIMAISRIMQHIDRFAYYVAYAAGFATGNWIGMILEVRLAIGIERIRFMISENNIEAARKAIPQTYNCISYSANHNNEQIIILDVTTNRKQVPQLVANVTQACPNTHYTREDIRASSLVAK